MVANELEKKLNELEKALHSVSSALTGIKELLSDERTLFKTFLLRNWVFLPTEKQDS